MKKVFLSIFITGLIFSSSIFNLNSGLSTEDFSFFFWVYDGDGICHSRNIWDSSKKGGKQIGLTLKAVNNSIRLVGPFYVGTDFPEEFTTNIVDNVSYVEQAAPNLTVSPFFRACP